MEPLSQALLGAATAEAVAGPKLRRRALFWGALIGMSPDLDVLLGPLRDGYGEWLYHRGTTHSLWFGFAVGPLLGWALWRWRDHGRPGTLPGWIRLSIVALLTHPLLDGFTPYGTQLFAPFWRERFAWNGIAIVDPFYTLLLASGVVCAATLRFSPTTRRKGLLTGLALSTLYLLAGLGVNRWVVDDLRSSLASEVVEIERIRAYPTIFQPWLRSFVVRTPSSVLVGLHSWQESGCPAWQVHPRGTKDPAVQIVRTSPEGALLEWFADGDTASFVHSEPGGTKRVRVEDIRYGWASAGGRGMWGLEARVDAEGKLVSPPRRIGRVAPNRRDFDRIGRLLSGRLPSQSDGWRRPPGCFGGPPE
jgi:inner membrane protein